MKKNQRLMKIGDPDNNSKREKEKKLQTQNKKKKWEKKNGGAEKNGGTQDEIERKCDDGIIIFLFFVRKKFRKLKKIKCGYSVNHSVFLRKNIINEIKQ